MAKVKASGTSDAPKRGRPALSPEARENQLISLAEDLAEQQLRDGTASSQVITHYLKLGTTRERLEKELLSKQLVLTDAKTNALKEQKDMKVLYEKAIKAIQRYNGHADSDEQEFDY